MIAWIGSKYFLSYLQYMNKKEKEDKEKIIKEAKMAEKRKLEILAERSNPKYQAELRRRLNGIHPDKDFETFKEYFDRRWNETMRDDDLKRMHYMNLTKMHGQDYAKKDFANTICDKYTKLYFNHPNYKEPTINKLSKEKK